jgi:tetratricopeptide (TPR) repeat protein
MKSMKTGLAWKRAVKLAVAAMTMLFHGGHCAAGPSLASRYGELQSDAARMHFEHGLQLAQRGDLQAAEEELRAAAKLRPGDAEYLATLATVLAIEKKLEESTSFFEKALKIRPGDLRSRRDLSANLWQLRRYAQAKQHLQTLLRESPTDRQAKLLLGLVSEKTRDYSTAVTMLQSIPELVRAEPEAILALAKSYYRIGEGQKAADALSALEDGPGGAAGALLGSQAAEEMRDYATAEKLLSTIPDGSVEFQTARYRLAVVKFNDHQYAESQRILQDLIHSGQKKGAILRLSGWCYHKTDRDEDAIRTFREAIQLDPADEKNFLDLGALLVEQRKFSAAMELANRMTSAFPRSADARVFLGSIEFATEHFTDAVESYSRSLQLDRDNRDAILGLAKAQAAAGMQGQAKKTLEDAIERFPGEATFELQLALLLNESESQGSPQQARTESLLRSAVKHDPNLAEAQYQLGDLALRRGQTAVAIAHLKNAAKISPESAKAHFALARAYRRAGRTEDAARETALYEALKRKSNSGGKTSPNDAQPSE